MSDTFWQITYAIGVAQGIFVVIRLIAGNEVNWFGVFFTLSLVLVAGVIGENDHGSTSGAWNGAPILLLNMSKVSRTNYPIWAIVKPV